MKECCNKFVNMLQDRISIADINIQCCLDQDEPYDFWTGYKAAIEGLLEEMQELH